MTLQLALNLYRSLIPIRFRLIVYRHRLKLKALGKIIGLKEDALRLIVKPTYADDGFSTLHFMGYLKNEPLNSAFKESLQDLPNPLKLEFSSIGYRAHICAWAYEKTKNLDGDIASFGVNWGVLEKTIAECKLNGEKKGDKIKKLFLFDTWGEVFGGHEDYKADNYLKVIERFKKYKFVEFIRGLVPESFANAEISRLSLVLIDLNGADAEQSVLRQYYDKIVPGGIIYFDDYGWNYPRLRNVVDTFLSDKPESLLHFPSGNAILIKELI